MTGESNTVPGGIAAENEAVVRELFERIYSKGELDRIADVVASDFVGDGPGSDHPYVGTEGIRSRVVELRTAFGGFTVDIEDLQIRGDAFEVSWTATGRQERRFDGVDPTCIVGRAGVEPHGSPIAVAGRTVGTIRDGRIQESRSGWDVSALRRQLGAPDGQTPGRKSGSLPRRGGTRSSTVRKSPRRPPSVSGHTPEADDGRQEPPPRVPTLRERRGDVLTYRAPTVLQLRRSDLLSVRQRPRTGERRVARNTGVLVWPA